MTTAEEHAEIIWLTRRCIAVAHYYVLSREARNDNKPDFFRSIAPQELA